MHQAVIFLTTTSSLFAIIIAVRVFNSLSWGKCKIKKNLKGKTIVVTGANCGIGKETAQELVRQGARVIMACRNEEKAVDAIKDITKRLSRHESQSSHGQLIYKHIDLASFDSVKSFAADLAKSEPCIDILINNAGVLGCPFEVTQDGYEIQMQVNHLSHALLSMLLMPKLQESYKKSNERARIIMLTSTLYKNGQIRDADLRKGLASAQNYNQMKAYSNGKLANILFSRELAKSLQRIKSPVDIYLASPGIVGTHLMRHQFKFWKAIFFAPIALMIMRTPYEGCQTVLHCVLSDSQLLKSGQLYRNCKQEEWSEKVDDPEISAKVYHATVNIVENV